MSGRSRRVDIAPDAQEDLAVIARFSKRRWGEKQRDDYIRGLTDMMEMLTEFPHLGEPRDNLRQGMRARIVAEHVIYYRITDDAITVLRVLHQSMDAVSQFIS